MKKTILVSAFVCLFFFVGIAHEARAQNSSRKPGLSVQDAIMLAFQKNKDIRVATEELKVGRAKILGATSKFLPTIDMNTSVTHNDAILNLGNLGQGGKRDVGVLVGYENDGKAAITYDHTLFNGGQNVATYKSAKATYNLDEETLRAKKLEVEYEVRRLYYGVLYAYETFRITQDLLFQAKRHYQDVKNKFEAGTASDFDFLQAKVHVATIMPQFMEAKKSIQVLSAELRRLLGMNINETLIFTDPLNTNFIEVSEEAFLQKAYMQNPAMRVKDLNIDIKKWAIDIAQSTWFPDLELQGQYYYRSDSMGHLINKRHRNWNVAGVVTIPLFDGFSTQSKVDEARAQHRQVIVEKEDLVNEIAVNIRSGCWDIRQARTQIYRQKESIREAEDALKIAEVSYEVGEGTSLDVLDAQVSLSQVRKNLIEGVYDYIMAKAYLDKTMGVLSIEEDGYGKKA